MRIGGLDPKSCAFDPSVPPRSGEAFEFLEPMNSWRGEVLALLAAATPAQTATYNVTDNCDVPGP